MRVHSTEPGAHFGSIVERIGLVALGVGKMIQCSSSGRSCLRHLSILLVGVVLRFLLTRWELEARHAFFIYDESCACTHGGE